MPCQCLSAAHLFALCVSLSLSQVLGSKFLPSACPVAGEEEPCTGTKDGDATQCSDHALNVCNDTTTNKEGIRYQCQAVGTNCLSSHFCTLFPPEGRVKATLNMVYYPHPWGYPDIIAFDKNGKKLQVCRWDGLGTAFFTKEHDDKEPYPNGMKQYNLLSASIRPDYLEYLTDGYFGWKRPFSGANFIVQCVKDTGDNTADGGYSSNSCFEGGTAAEQTAAWMTWNRNDWTNGNNTIFAGTKEWRGLFEIFAMEPIAKIRILAASYGNGFPTHAVGDFQSCKDAWKLKRGDDTDGTFAFWPPHYPSGKNYGSPGSETPKNGPAFVDINFD